MVTAAAATATTTAAAGREFTWKLRETGTKKNVIEAAEEAEKVEKTKCAGKQGRKGKKMNVDKVRNVSTKKRVCTRTGEEDAVREEGRTRSGVSRNAVRVWRTKAKGTE